MPWGLGMPELTNQSRTGIEPENEHNMSPLRGHKPKSGGVTGLDQWFFKLGVVTQPNLRNCEMINKVRQKGKKILSHKNYDFLSHSLSINSSGLSKGFTRRDRFALKAHKSKMMCQWPK